MFRRSLAAGPKSGCTARELIFAVMFLALAWWEWHGLLAVAIILLLLAEFAVSTIDTIVELDTRILPVTERCAHVLLFVNFGILIALLGQALLTWGQQPTGLVATSYGALSWLLSILGALALGWSVRDAIAALRREPVGLPSTAPDHPRALSRG